MKIGSKRWIVAEYPNSDPRDVIQIGIHTDKKLAEVQAAKWKLSRKGTEWNVVIFEAELIADVH